MTILRWLEFVALSIWLGSDIFLSFVVAPGAFRPRQPRPGRLDRRLLAHPHALGGVICGVLFLLFRLLRTRSFASCSSPAALCVLLMILLTVISQLAVSPKMAALRVQMGSIQATAADSPLLAEFSRLHRMSVSLESVVLFAGFAALYPFRSRNSRNRSSGKFYREFRFTGTQALGADPSRLWYAYVFLRPSAHHDLHPLDLTALSSSRTASLILFVVL